MTAAIEGGEWSAARPDRTLPPRKTRYPFYRRLGGPQGWSGQAENLVPTGLRSLAIEPVVNIVCVNAILFRVLHEKMLEFKCVY